MKKVLHISIFRLKYLLLLMSIPGTGLHIQASSIVETEILNREGCITFLLDFCGADDSGGGYFAADFQGWDPVPMCDYGGVWEISFCGLDAGTYQYKFLNGPGGWEFDGFGDSCTNPADNNNRFVTVTGSCDIEGPWCWSQCIPGSGSPSDTEAPVIVNPPDDITISCSEDLPEPEVLEAEDECSYNCTSELPVDDMSGLDACGLGEILRTWQVFDCAGNEGNPYTQVILIQDFDSPSIDNSIADITISCNDPLPEAVPLEAEDDCDNLVFETEPPVDDLSMLDMDGTGELIRTWYVEDCRGNFEEFSQTITITGLTAQIYSGSLCADSAFIFTDSFDFYSWVFVDTLGQETDLNTNNDTVIISQSGIYNLTVGKGLCTTTVQDTFNLFSGIDYTITSSTLCNDSINGQSSINLIDLVENIDDNDSLQFFDMNGDLLTQSQLDFHNAQTGEYIFLVEIIRDTVCPPAMDSVFIDVRDCGCPMIDDIGPVCLSFELDTIDLSFLSPDDHEGSWILEPAVTGINLENELLIISGMTGIGEYSILYLFEEDDINANCAGIIPPPNESTFELIDPNEPELYPDLLACNMDTDEIIPTLIDLDTLLLTTNTGSWNVDPPTINISVDNIVDFSDSNTGDYVFTFTQDDAIFPCLQVSDQLTITVLDCSCPPIAVVPDSTVCTSTVSLDLTQFALAGTGSWTYLDDGPDPDAQLSADNIFNIDGLMEGDYTFEFELDDNNAGTQCISSMQSVITIFNPPFAELLISDSIVCNMENPIDFPYILDFNQLLNIQSDVGLWSSPTYTGDLSDPTFVDFNGVTAGQYLFNYETIIATQNNSPCEEASVALNILVEDCSCPELPDIEIKDLCTENDELDLTPLNSNVGPGIWSVTDPVGAESIIDTTIWEIENFMPGIYTVNYSFQEDMVPFVCVNNIIEYEVVLTAPPVISLPGNITVCDRSGSSIGPSVIDFNDITPPVEGNWIAPTEYPGDFTDLSLVDFEGLTNEQYTFQFITDLPDHPCPPVMVEMIVMVEACDCPDLQFSPVGDICNQDAPVELSDLLNPGIIDGEFNLFNTSGDQITIGNEIIDPSLLSEGEYVLSYLATNQVPSGCDQSYSTTFNVFEAPFAGNDTSVEYCIGESLNINLQGVLTDEDEGGMWIQIDGPQISLESDNPVIELESLVSGIYSFQYELNPVGPCNGSYSVMDLIIVDLPVADAGQDLVLDCQVSEVLLGEFLTADPGLSYLWLNDIGTVLNINGEIEIPVDSPGDYILMTTDLNTQCVNSDTLNVMSIDNTPEMEVNSLPTSCYDSMDGQIEVVSVQGGDGNYQFNLEGPVTEVLESLSPVMFTDLISGTYIMTVESLGCISEALTVVVEQPELIEVVIQDDIIEFEAGTGTEVEFQISGNAVLPVEVNWINEFGTTVCEGFFPECSTINLNPDVPTIYTVLITDSNGCLASGQVTLVPVTIPNIFVPNILSANSQDENSELRVFTNSAVTSLEKYIVYDRWGNVVYSDEDGKLLNDPSEEWWDGKIEGQDLVQGVYVLYIEYYENGQNSKLKSEAFSVTVFN